MNNLTCLQLLLQMSKSFWDETLNDMKAALRQYGDQSTEVERLLRDLTWTTNMFERTVQAIAKVKQDNANLTKIQAPSTVQPETPQLAKNSYRDTQAFFDQNLGSSDATYDQLR